jgi:hypothetical protein
MPSSHDEFLCPCCILVYFDELISFLAVCIQICTLLRVAQLYGILHKATLSSENPTIEFSSEFKKVIKSTLRNQFYSSKKQMLLFLFLSLSLSSRFPMCKLLLLWKMLLKQWDIVWDCLSPGTWPLFHMRRYVTSYVTSISRPLQVSLAKRSLGKICLMWKEIVLKVSKNGPS